MTTSRKTIFWSVSCPRVCERSKAWVRAGIQLDGSGHDCLEG